MSYTGNRNYYHVIPHPDGGWAAKRPMADRVSKIAAHRGTVASWCWDRARRPDRVIIHKPDGSIDWIQETPGERPTE